MELQIKGKGMTKMQKGKNEGKNVTRPNMALSWTKNTSFLVLNVKANRLRRRGREKEKEGRRKKKKKRKAKV